MKEILAGSTNQTVDVFIQDSSATDGSGLTGLAYNTSGLTCYYRKGATGSWTQLTLATQTIGGAHSDGGFVEGDPTNAPGMYRLDVSDAMVDTAGLLKIMLKGATNMAPVPLEIEVVSVDKYDATRLGLSALPNADADAAGGLVISDAGGLDIDAMDTSVSNIETDTNSLNDTKVPQTLNLTASGNIGIDWANVENPTTTVDLSGTTVKSTYWADIELTIDDANGQDEYTVTWYKDGVRQTTGITSPTIQVIKRADGTDLVASTAMTEIGSTGSYSYDEATNRVTAGEAVLVVVAATIDSGARTFSRVLTRDSSS